MCSTLADALWTTEALLWTSKQQALQSNTKLLRISLSPTSSAWSFSFQSRFFLPLLGLLKLHVKMWRPQNRNIFSQRKWWVMISKRKCKLPTEFLWFSRKFRARCLLSWRNQHCNQIPSLITGLDSKLCEKPNKKWNYTLRRRDSFNDFVRCSSSKFCKLPAEKKTCLSISHTAHKQSSKCSGFKMVAVESPLSAAFR